MQQLSAAENAQVESTPLSMYNKFIERVRRNLHVVLAFSPIGDAFRNRLRMFPSLINCCTIDWFKVRDVQDRILFYFHTHADYLGSVMLLVDSIYCPSFFCS